MRPFVKLPEGYVRMVGTAAQRGKAERRNKQTTAHDAEREADDADRTARDAEMDFAQDDSN